MTKMCGIAVTAMKSAECHAYAYEVFCGVVGVPARVMHDVLGGL